MVIVSGTWSTTDVNAPGWSHRCRRDPAGSFTTYLFQSRTAERAQSFERDERLRYEQVNACSAFASAMTELKRGLIALWFYHQRDAAGTDCAAARIECDRLGASAEAARFRVQLSRATARWRCWQMPHSLRSAPSAALLTGMNCANARTTSKPAVTMFIHAASRRLRTPAPASAPGKPGQDHHVRYVAQCGLELEYLSLTVFTVTKERGAHRRLICSSAPAMPVSYGRKPDWFLPGSAVCALSHWCNVRRQCPRPDPDRVQARGTAVFSRPVAASGERCGGRPAGGPRPVQQTAAVAATRAAPTAIKVICQPPCRRRGPHGAAGAGWRGSLRAGSGRGIIVVRQAAGMMSADASRPQVAAARATASRRSRAAAVRAVLRGWVPRRERCAVMIVSCLFGTGRLSGLTGRFAQRLRPGRGRVTPFRGGRGGGVGVPTGADRPQAGPPG